MHPQKRRFWSSTHLKTSIFLSLVTSQFLTPFTIIQTTAAAQQDTISKECQEHCDSNRPTGNSSAYIFNCSTSKDPNNCDVDKLCQKFNCSTDICKNGVIQCPSTKVAAAKPRSVNDNSSNGGFFSSIPIWFYVLIGVVLLISCISVIFGFATRRHRYGGGPVGMGYGGGPIPIAGGPMMGGPVMMGGYGGYGDPYYGGGGGCGGGHYHYHDDGCGGGHYHHHNDGCGGGYHSHHSMFHDHW